MRVLYDVHFASKSSLITRLEDITAESAVGLFAGTLSQSVQKKLN